MLTHAPTRGQIESWRRTFETYAPRLKPNRRSGEEVQSYLLKKYPVRELEDAACRKLVVSSVLENAPLAEKLPAGASPRPYCCIVRREGAGKSLYERQDSCFQGIDIFVGIDLVTGYFTVEGSSLLWDELFFFRGLDTADLKNYYLVAEYVSCAKFFGYPIE
ncbi:MAG TPA: hypothetical protein P5075_11810 [Eubacteriales bacterium]|nr:hypothetical protein [Eubacteriales bacterium]